MRDLSNTDVFLDVVEKATDAIDAIIADDEIKNSFRADSKWLFIMKLLKRHRDEVKNIVSALDGECPPEEVFAKYSPADLVEMFETVFTHPEIERLKQAFFSALRKLKASSSGTAQEATPV